MAKGFQAPNYTQIPNDLFDMIPEMGEALLRFLLAISRLTFGYHRDRARASLTKLEKMTGLSRPSVVKAAKQAEKLGLVEKHKDGGVNEWVVNVLNYQALGLVKPVNSTSKATLPRTIKQNEINNDYIEEETNPIRQKLDGKLDSDLLRQWDDFVFLQIKLQGSMPPDTFRAMVLPLTPLSLEEDILTLICLDQYHLDFTQSRLVKTIVRQLTGYLNNFNLQIKLVTLKEVNDL